MKPLIKWPGGKSRELAQVYGLIPEYDRYLEPFFGGGALFFHLAPKSAAINDISESLIQYYKLIKNQDKQLYDLLMCYNNILSLFLKQNFRFWSVAEKLNAAPIVACEFAADAGFLQFIHSLLCGFGTGV